MTPVETGTNMTVTTADPVTINALAAATQAEAERERERERYEWIVGRAHVIWHWRIDNNVKGDALGDWLQAEREYDQGI